MILRSLKADITASHPENSGMDANFSLVDGLPVVTGSVREFAADPVACMTQLQGLCGDLFAIREGDQQVIFALGADYNRELLSQPNLFHSRFFAMRGSKNSAQRRLTSGLLSMNGPEHVQQRRVIKSAFSKHAISGYRDVVTQLTDDMLSDWRVGQVRDLSADMTQLMLRVTSSILFGMKTPELAFELGEMIHHWVELNHETGAAAFASEGNAFDRYQELLDYSQQVESRVKDMIATRRASTEGDADMLSLLIQSQESEEGMTEGQLIGQSALLFAAAHMTTAHSMMWTLFLLAQHPNIMQQLDTELEQPLVFADETSLLSTISLLDRVIRESMRILPASAYSQRIAQSQVQLGTATIPNGSIIIFSQFMTHRMESIYTSPRQFDPDRWLSIKPSPYEYLPFGGGPRLCLGAPLAQSIIRTVLPRILRRFSLATLANSEVSARVISTMLAPTTKVPLLVQPSRSPGATVTLRGNLPVLVDFDAAEPVRFSGPQYVA